MITVELSADALGQIIFSFSPLTESILSLRLLTQPHPRHVHRPWILQAREQLVGVDLELLLAVTRHGRYVPNAPVSPGRMIAPSVEDELDALSELSADDLRDDLDELWPTGTMPHRVEALLATGADAVPTLAAALWDYWDAAIQPFWSRMVAVLHDDVGHRMSELLTGGYYTLLNGLHPEIRIEGNLMCLDKPHRPGSTRRAQAMVLTPSIFAWPDLVFQDGGNGRLGLTYGSRGVARVWERPNVEMTQGSEPLATLVGRSRSAILRCTTVPMSTTEIAHELDRAPAGVSAHLAVLRDAGLVSSTRSGRSVLYKQTPLGEHVARSRRDAPADAQTLSRVANR